MQFGNLIQDWLDLALEEGTPQNGFLSNGSEIIYFTSLCCRLRFCFPLFPLVYCLYYEGKSVNKSQKAMKKILSEIFT
jgi:hypothetical protein